MNQETEKILLVYTGSYLDREDKIRDGWLLVTQREFEEGIVSECFRTYGGKNSRKHLTGQPGSVYEVSQTLDGKSIYPTEAKYKGLWPDQDQRMEWQAAHRVAVTDNDLRKKAKKEGQEDNFSALRPFRLRYDKLVSQNQKAALLAQVIAYITGGGL